MKVSKIRAGAAVGFAVTGLALVCAVSCSWEKRFEKTAAKQAKGSYYQKSDEQPVLNPFCRVCHLDFDEEELALDHELMGIGCERCHGESERHRSDEANVTPPEIMYPKAKINPTCMMCHPRHEIRHVKEHEPLFAGAKTVFDEEVKEAASKDSQAKEYCTDCHGKDHRMNVRTVRWDKATGGLIKTE